MPGRLRGKKPLVPFHVALVEPEIPPNTGNIARLTAATGTVLHLVGRLGFRIDEKAVRRAGLDYWHLVDLRTHVDFAHFLQDFMPGAADELVGPKIHLFTAKTERSYLAAGFQPGDALVFGKESVGLSEAILSRFPKRHLAIPTLGAVRSLNLAHAVGIGLYEALRQTGALEETFVD